MEIHFWGAAQTVTKLSLELGGNAFNLTASRVRTDCFSRCSEGSLQKVTKLNRDLKSTARYSHARNEGVAQ